MTLFLGVEDERCGQSSQLSLCESCNLIILKWLCTSAEWQNLLQGTILVAWCAWHHDNAVKTYWGKLPFYRKQHSVHRRSKRFLSHSPFQRAYEQFCTKHNRTWVWFYRGLSSQPWFGSISSELPEQSSMWCLAIFCRLGWPCYTDWNLLEMSRNFLRYYA